MRNYNSLSGLRPVQNHGEDEPELQWLEDGINYLVTSTFICLGLLVAAVFRGIVLAYDGLRKSSK